MTNNAYTIISLFYIVLVLLSFTFKKHIDTKENKIYKYLLITNFLGVLNAILCFITIMLRYKIPLINNIISKFLLVFFLLWLFGFTLYIFFISKSNYKSDKSYKIFKTILMGIFCIAIILVWILPLYYYGENGTAYSFGPSANVVYVMVGSMIILWLIICLINIRNLKNKKYLPVLAFIALIIPVVILQKINPALLLVTAMETFVTILMYFTIENPDVQMINELYKNQELVEQTYEDKSNFLFEMTGEVREPLVKISKLSESIKNENDTEKIKEYASEIAYSVKQLDFTVNDVLNVTSLDSNKLKIIDNKYSLKYLYDDLVSRIKPVIKENIEFRSDTPNNLPILYGDSIKLKQVLYSILMNSANKTKEGFIEFKIDLIERYDVARIIFTIMDSGSGMDIDKINEILSVTGEFSSDELKMLEKSEINVKLCQKVIKVLDGNLLIKSQPGIGTKTILTIDQKIFKKESLDTVLNQYENAIYKSKRVLVVSQDKDKKSLIINKLKKNGISYSHILYGADAVDRIKSGKKYDYILIDDEMKEMSGYTTLKELEKINGFKIPVIIMLYKNKENIKEHYLNDGFTDYILLDDIDKELDKIINKY